MSDNTHAAMCVYCGEAIIYDTREVTDMTDAHTQIVEHDQQCPKNPLVEDLARHKRMFAAACETLGEIQQALGNSVVGIEPTLVKELVEERDALAAHVERINACRLESGRIGIWSLNNALKETPTTSLARRDALKQMEGMEGAALHIRQKALDYDSEHGSTDPSTGTREYPVAGAEYFNEMMELADEIHQQADEIRQQAEGHQ